MIKKIIMNWVEDYVNDKFNILNEKIDHKIEVVELSILEKDILDKLTDKEIIEKFKHSKFSELSGFLREYLINRYNLKYSRFYSVWLSSETVFPSSFVADIIEKVLVSRKEAKESTND